MKAQKVIAISSVILLVIIITAASFIGIYQKKEYKVSNAVPSYKLGMEFTDSRIVKFMVDSSIKSTKIYDSEGNVVEKKEDGVDYTEENGYRTEEIKANPDEVLTKENYKKAKDILISRLNNIGVGQYIIKQDEENGAIEIEIPEDENTSDIISMLNQTGVFELTDAETNEVLLNNSYIDDINVVYGQNQSGLSVYLQVKFNKEGQAKLEEISKIYIETKEEVTDENGETKEESNKKNVNVVLDGETYRTTYFGETITDGNLSIVVGTATDVTTVQAYSKEASSIAIPIKTGILPISYNTSSHQISPMITSEQINIIVYIGIGLLAIMLIFLLIKFKLKGIFAVILNIGYVALLLLIIRYTNSILITIDGMIGIAISIILNYIYIYLAFKNTESSFVTGLTAKYALELAPIYIIAAVFTFNTIANVASLGMTLVWGVISMYIYNLVLTQVTVKTINK